jgi:hypothetical protein
LRSPQKGHGKPNLKLRVKNNPKKEMAQAAVRDTNKKTLAGKQLQAMSVEGRSEVSEVLDKTLSKEINKTVKVAVIFAKYKELVSIAFTAALTACRRPPTSTAMVHERKKTLYEEYGLLAKVKVGDFVLVEACYTPGICSEGGVAMVERFTPNVVRHLEDTTEIGSDDDPLGPDGPTVAYVLTRCVERGVSLDRVTVVPMPYKDCNDPGLRTRITKPILVTTSVVCQLSPLGWLSLGKQTRRHEKKGWLRTLLQHEARRLARQPHRTVESCSFGP